MSYKSVSKFLSLATVALVAVLAMTGCGSKKSANQVVTNPYGYGTNCPTGCVGSGGVNIMAAARNDAGIYLQLQFTSAAAGSTYSSQSYDGPVTAVGTITVQTQAWRSCGIPMGQYQVQAQGSWYGTSIFENMQIQMPGGVLPMRGALVSSGSGGISTMNVIIAQNSICELRLY